jgi:NAD(P)-dependent dehydrogenase (short-subunit alcohol dehydrogenase family)
MMLGKTALVTGGGRGIGRATSILLASQGFNVCLCARTKRDADETAGIISAKGGSAVSFECDVTSETRVKIMFAEIKSKFGGVDVLVNNAGVFSYSLIEEASLEEFNRVLSGNLTGAFLCCREAFRQMREKGGGSIVNVSSLSGLKGAKKFPGFTAYAASKSGVVGITEVLAEEGRPHNIRVNAVCPGSVDTIMLKKAFPNAQQKLSPEQVAEAIAFLAGPGSSAVNGVCLELQSDLLPQK